MTGTFETPQRAVMFLSDGSVVELDLHLATPEEAAMAITDHRELDLVRALIRAIHQHKENAHVVE
jgi:hypothetical protein